jgi:hypothetical protein
MLDKNPATEPCPSPSFLIPVSNYNAAGVCPGLWREELIVGAAECWAGWCQRPGQFLLTTSLESHHFLSRDLKKCLLVRD